MGDWKFNKGEWGEAYVFLRLLGVGRIFGANREFKKDENVYNKTDGQRTVRLNGFTCCCCDNP